MSISEIEMLSAPKGNYCLCGRPVALLIPPLKDDYTQDHCEHKIPIGNVKTRKPSKYQRARASRQ